MAGAGNRERSKNKSATRPSWDEYFVRISQEVATRSTCLRRHVGAVLVREKRLLCTGYNGVPMGLSHCSDRGCPRAAKGVASGTGWEICRGLHAEMNALLQAAIYGIVVGGATIYTTSFPCSLCAKMLINTGIERIVAVGDYPDELAKEMLAEAGVVVEMFDEETHKTRRILPEKGRSKRKARNVLPK